MNFPNHNTRRAWHPALRPVSGLLIAAQIALAVQPLSALAQDNAKGAAVSPLVQAQLNRLNLFQRDRELARVRAAQERQNPADQASGAQAEIETLVLSLQQHVTAAVPAPAPLRAAGARDGTQATGGKSSRAIRLSDTQVQQHQSRLRDLLAQRAAHRKAQEDRFAQDRAELKANERLSADAKATMLQRHDEAAAQYRERDQRYQALAATYVNYPTEQNLDDLARFVQQHRSAKRPTPTIDPGTGAPQMPWRSPQPLKRPPAETRTAWHWQLHQDHYEKQSVKLAQLGTTNIGGIAFTVPPEPSRAPQAADLGETEDIVLTPAIRAKAQELEYNPVKIHNWLASTIVWQPTWGSIQGAEGTLRSQRGNAIDIASLHIALLRASSIPARYQFGTIEIPVEQLNNWIGGVQKGEAALQLLAQGGIAARGVVEAGRFSKVRMEHVWVNAYVHWAPGRGSQPGGVIGATPGNPGGTLTTPQGHIQHPSPNAHRNAWVPMDASYKQYRYSPGMNLAASVPLDTTALLAAASQGATINEAQGYVQNLNQANLQAQLDAYQTRLKNHIDSSPTGASSTVGDVIGTQGRQTVTHAVLAGTTPMPVVSHGSEMTGLPENLRWKITFKLYASDNDKVNGSAALSHRLLLSQIGSRRISAHPVGSTLADRDLLNQYISTGATSLPLYLIRQNVQLKLDEQVLAEAAPQRMGDVQWWSYVIEGPNLGSVEEDFKYETVVGDAIVFGVDSVGVTLKEVSERFSAVNPNSAYENLHHLNLGYFARANWSDQGFAKILGFVTQRLPSIGLFASPLTIQYSWGIPRKGSFQSYAIDIRRLTQSSFSSGSDAAALSNSKLVDFNIQLGLKNSYLEGAIFEEIFDLSKGRGFSAAALLSEASKNGIRIYEITQTNIQEFLANSTTLSSSVRLAINNYVDAGYVVMAPVETVDAINWKGEGYVALDPATGSGAYIIASGANGGELSECETKSEPLAKSLGDRINTIIILAAVAALIAAGIILAPPSGGTSLGGSGVAVAKLMAAVGMTTLAFSGTAQAAGRCPADKCHRGTIQAQGKDIPQNRNTVSLGWAEASPFTVSQGLALIEGVKSGLTPSQLTNRAAYFLAAEEWIKSLPPNGICGGGPTKSFGPDPTNERHDRDKIRVDIKIYAGEAFSK